MPDSTEQQGRASSRSIDIHRLSQHLAIMSMAAELAEMALRRNDAEEALLRVEVVLAEIERLRELTGPLKGVR
ncbi:MAG: hypothetical protein K2X46_19005 [Roseomonas sp.]|nr:hypothetical protein [Roseomonas sp.]